MSMNVRACVLVVELSIRWKVNRAEKIEQEKKWWKGERDTDGGDDGGSSDTCENDLKIKDWKRVT